MERERASDRVTKVRGLLSDDAIDPEVRSDGSIFLLGDEDFDRFTGQQAFDGMAPLLDIFILTEPIEGISRAELWGPSLLRPSTHTYISPWVLHGEPCVTGSRIPSSDLYALRMERGLADDQIQALYPQLSASAVGDAIELEKRLRAAQRRPMRLLLDEGFPSPPGFDAAMIDASVEVTTLLEFDLGLVGVQTPDWYLYLRAHEAGFDALVTRDWHQSEQPEELWALTRTSLSIVTWRRSIEDPVREWGQLFAYMPELRRMLAEHGPSVVFLPSPRLDKSSIRKASAELGKLASDLGISNNEIRHQARLTIRDELEDRDELDRFGEVLAQYHHGHNRTKASVGVARRSASISLR